MDISHPENLIRLALAPRWLGKSEAVIPCLRRQLLLYNLRETWGVSHYKLYCGKKKMESPFKEIFISKSKHQGNHLKIIIINLLIEVELSGSSLAEKESEYRDCRCQVAWWILQLGKVRWNITGAIIHQQEKREIDQKTWSVTTSIFNFGDSNKVWF